MCNIIIRVIRKSQTYYPHHPNNKKTLSTLSLGNITNMQIIHKYQKPLSILSKSNKTIIRIILNA